MIYSVNKMKQITESISTHLTIQEKEIMQDFLEKYNRLFLYAKDKEEYIERKQAEYVKESEQNNKLIIQNRELTEKIERLKHINEKLREENQKLILEKKC